MTGARTLIVRWGACYALAICFHAAGGVALLTRWNENADAVANAAIITIELASLPVAPDIKPTELPPGPQQTEAQPEPASIEPVQKVEIPPDPQAEPVLAVTPPPTPIEKRKKSRDTCMRALPERRLMPS